MRTSSSMSGLNALMGRFMPHGAVPLRHPGAMSHGRPLLQELALGFAPYVAVLAVLLIIGA